MVTPGYKHTLTGVVTKEEDIDPVDMVVLEDKNVSDSTTEAYTDMHSPDLVLSEQHHPAS